VNWALELPGVYEVSYVAFWCTNLVFGPTYAALLFAWWVIEGVTGKWWPRYNSPQPGQAIFITGCDTGFGHETTLRMARAGWTVYAGCLTDAGMAALGEKAAAVAGGAKVVPVKMDVTKPEDVEKAVRRLVDDKVSLYALVNNAVRVCLFGRVVVCGFGSIGRSVD
jgi:3-hydroxybutyrate dehydrogenase